VITLGALNDVTGVRHGFFTREGGVSTGLYASLNCGYGSGDAPAAVAENRTRAMRRLGAHADRLVTAYQIHSPTCVVVEEPWAREDAPQADAMVTTVPGLALGILTADCAPVLLADPSSGVIGAAHAGWKGALGGVIDGVVKAMTGFGARPADIVAAVGPCIAQRSYEVGPEFPLPFLDDDPAAADYFAVSPRPGHHRFDLSSYVVHRLHRAGVRTVQRSPNDTATEEERFFSYRRATLRGEKEYGRGLSAIVLMD
jgi:polyphenol oxidase